MALKEVHRSKAVPGSPDQVWAVLGDFDLTWHPFVTDCVLLRDPSGSLVREFTTMDGGRLVERRTSISDTDRTLSYTALSGINGALSYGARVHVTEADGGSLVTWHARIVAPDDRAAAIAEGTAAVFDAGLDRLARDLPEPRRSPLRRTAAASISEVVMDGTPRLSLLKAGAGEGLVLFLHGIGGQAANWTPQLTALGGEAPMAALNLRGYGGSTLGFAPTQVDDYCDDILAVADHFGAERLVLVGLSLGSWLATSFALRHGDRLAGLVLAGGCTGMSEAGPEERESFRLSREVPLSEGKSPADFAADVVPILAGPKAGPDVRDHLHGSMAAIPAETYRDALACFCNPPERFDFARISCPVLLMTGRYDRLAPPDEIRRVSERMAEARALADVRFEVIEDAGHLCNLEAPEVFNAHLHRFLARLPGVIGSHKPSRAEKRQEKRRRILDAAHAEFCQAGFDGASMDRLAAAAGVSKPTLYQYFGDKEGLFSAVLDQGRAHIVAPLMTRSGPLVDRLWRFAWTYAEYVLRPDMLSLARLILGEAARRPLSARRYHQSGPAQAFEGLVEFVTAAAGAGELAVQDPRLAANDLWSLILSGPRDHYLHHVDDRPTEAELLQSIGHGLRIFLKAYSTDPKTDQALLEQKIAARSLAVCG